MARKGPRRRYESPHKTKLELFRIGSGLQWHVRLLGLEMAGLFYHWGGQKGAYCTRRHDKGCSYCPKERNWRGYLAVDVYVQSDDAWYPCVLEITENAELDMRGVFERGQVWLFSRAADLDGKKAPVNASLVEERSPKTCPHAFDVAPLLQRLYNRPDGMLLDERNPMPARLRLEPSHGDGPIKQPSAEPGRVTAEELEQARDKARRAGLLPPKHA